MPERPELGPRPHLGYTASAVDRAADLAPTLAQIQADGAVTLKDIAAALDAAGIATPPRSGQMEPGSG